MPKTPTWHSVGEDVHHDNSECLRAAEVPPSERIEGDGDLPLCPLCERLDRAETSLS